MLNETTYDDREPHAPSGDGEATQTDDRLPSELKTTLAVLLVGAFVMILNETVMSVALPTLMVEFDVGAGTAQWMTTAFLLTMAVVIPLTGVMLQRFSTRTMYVAAVGTFTLGTALAALAPVFGVLVAARVIQATGTAIMLPLLTTTVLTFVPAARRGQVMGLISIVIAVAPAVGPTYSGLVLDVLSWRWIFLTVLPVALVTLVIGRRFIRDFSEHRHIPFDLLSVALSALGFGGLIYGLSSIGKAVEGDAPVPPAIPLVLGALALGLFVWRQTRLQREDRPLLDMRVFASRQFVLGLGILMVAMSALFGALILLPMYMQNVRGLSTLQTGLMLLPGGLAMGIVAPFVGRAFDRWGPRPLVIPGAVLLTAAMASFYLTSTTTALWVLVATHIVMSMGLGMLMTPLMTSALGSLPSARYSHGSAIANTLQQLAGAAGTALFVSVMTARSASFLAGGADPTQAQALGIHDAFLWGAILAAAAALLSFTIRRPAHTPPAGLH